MVAFPLIISPNGRYFLDSNGVPFPVLDYAFWCFSCVSSTSDKNSFITKLLALGINSVHVFATVGNSNWSGTNIAPDMSGNLPWTTKTGGGSYTGTLGTADVSTTNDAYWTTVSGIIDSLKTNGILCHFHPAYLGNTPLSGGEGIGQDMINTGTSGCTTFGTYIAGKFKQSNIIWCAYGDTYPPDTAGLQAVHNAFWNAVFANAVQQPLLAGGQNPHVYGDPCTPNNGDSPLNGNFNVRSGYVTLNQNSSPHGGGEPLTYTNPLDQSKASPTRPSYMMDTDLYENDPTVPGVPVGPNDVRRRWWWSLLTGTAGVSWGNELTSNCGSTTGLSGSFTFANANTSSGFITDGHTHLTVGINIWLSLPWWKLLPGTVGPVGTLITSGAGTFGGGANNNTVGQDWVAAVADPRRSCLLAYVPQLHSGSFTVDMTKCGANPSAYWVDPTNGSRTYIGSFANTGTRAFTTPGNNAYGSADWLLLILAASDALGGWAA